MPTSPESKRTTSATQRTAAAASESPPPAQVRLGSIDAYRGLAMTLMLAEVLRLRQVADAIGDSPFWNFLGEHQSHVEWVGCSLHDLIQPSFSFVVGVALPFSLANRAARGESDRKTLLHAWWRAFLLVALGIFLRSLGREQTNFTFEDTLTQIGLGYGCLFLLARRSVLVQGIALAVILLGYWMAFALYPLPGPEFDWLKAGVPADWPHHLSGFAAHWNKNTNLAWAFDNWFLNLFPREQPFEYNSGGYATLSFIPTLGTMTLGLLAGGVLQSARSNGQKLGILLGAAAACFAVSLGVDYLGLCPIVKRIWTPSWTLFSGGWCLCALTLFYGVIDVAGLKRWAFPLVVVGANSIVAYSLEWLAAGFVRGALRRHLPDFCFTWAGAAYEPLLEGLSVLLLFWLFLFALYRKRIFVRI